VSAPEAPIGQTLPLPEQVSSAPEIAPQPQPVPVAQTAVTGTPIAAPLAGPAPTQVPTTAVPQTTQVAVPATADDADLIEKEWVAKAKQIVERTRHDPHEQSKELTIFKNDYLQKRYNKSIKMSE